MEYIDTNGLRTERIRRGLSQKELADHIGISKRSIINFEKGHAPSLPTAIRLADFFQVNVEQLFQISEGD